MTTAASIILAASTMFSPFRTGTYFSITGMCFTADGSFGDHDIVETDVPGVSTGAVKRITQGNARAIVAIADGALERLVLPQSWSAVDGDLDEYGSKHIAYPGEIDQRSVNLLRIPKFVSWTGTTNYWGLDTLFYSRPSERDFNRTAGRTLSRIDHSARFLADGVLESRYTTEDDVAYSSSLFGGDDFIDYEYLPASNVVEKVTNAVDSLVYTSLGDDVNLNATNHNRLILGPWFYNPAIYREGFIEWRDALLNTKRAKRVLQTNLLASAANSVVDDSKFASTNRLLDLHIGNRLQTYPLELRAAAMAAVDKTYLCAPDYTHRPTMVRCSLDKPFGNYLTYEPQLEAIAKDAYGDIVAKITLGEATGGVAGLPEISCETNVYENNEYYPNAAFVQVDASTFYFSFSGYVSYDHFDQITFQTNFVDYTADITPIPGGPMRCRVYDGQYSYREVWFDSEMEVPHKDDFIKKRAAYTNNCIDAYSYGCFKSQSLVNPGMKFDFKKGGDIGFMRPCSSYYDRIDKVVLQLGCELYPGPVYHANHVDTDADGMHIHAYLMCERMRQKSISLFEAQAMATPDRLDGIIAQHMSKLTTDALKAVDGRFVKCGVEYTPLVAFFTYSNGSYSLYDSDHNTLPRSKNNPKRFVTHIVTIGGTYENRRDLSAYSSYSPKFSRAIYWNFKNYPLMKKDKP